MASKNSNKASNALYNICSKRKQQRLSQTNTLMHSKFRGK